MNKTVEKIKEKVLFQIVMNARETDFKFYFPYTRIRSSTFIGVTYV